MVDHRMAELLPGATLRICSLMVRRTTIAGNCRFMDEVMSASPDSSTRVCLPLRAYRHFRFIGEAVSSDLDPSTNVLAIESLSDTAVL
jgi:hypothetical protein